jgi:hypothetical protein
MTNKVVIWGLPPNTHTHSYIHLGFAKAFSYLDYDVTWYDDSEEYVGEDLKDSIIITANICCNYLKMEDSSKYFVHNLADGFSRETVMDNIYNLLVYHENYDWHDGVEKVDDFSWYDSKSKTSVIMWGTDLLPHEIDDQEVCLYDESKEDVNYVGSLSKEYYDRFSNVVSQNEKVFNNYGGYTGIRSKNTDTGFSNDSEYIDLMKSSYLNFDLRPQVHLNNGYVPCRIFKALSYGSWIGTNSEKILNFFDGRITANSDLNELYLKTEEDSKNVSVESLIDNKNYIKQHHTYINRVNSLLSVL